MFTYSKYLIENDNWGLSKKMVWPCTAGHILYQSITKFLIPGTRKQNRDAWRADIQHRLVLPTPQNGTQTAPLSKNGYGWMGGCGNSSALVMKSPQCCAEHSMLHQTSNISCTLVGNKIVDHSDIFGAALVGELQVHLYSWLNTWLEWIRQRQLQDEARKFKFVDLVQLIL